MTPRARRPRTSIAAVLTACLAGACGRIGYEPPQSWMADAAVDAGASGADPPDPGCVPGLGKDLAQQLADGELSPPPSLPPCARRTVARSNSE